MLRINFEKKKKSLWIDQKYLRKIRRTYFVFSSFPYYLFRGNEISLKPICCVICSRKRCIWYTIRKSIKKKKEKLWIIHSGFSQKMFWDNYIHFLARKKKKRWNHSTYFRMRYEKCISCLHEEKEIYIWGYLSCSICFCLLLAFN